MPECPNPQCDCMNGVNSRFCRRCGQVLPLPEPARAPKTVALRHLAGPIFVIVVLIVALLGVIFVSESGRQPTSPAALAGRAAEQAELQQVIQTHPIGAPDFDAAQLTRELQAVRRRHRAQ